MPDTLLQDFHRQQEEQRRRLAIQVAQTQDHDPDRAARVWAVSAATGLPNEIADADLDNLESKLKQKRYSFEEYTDEETGSPIFNELATEDPYHWAVLNRDRQHMNAIERTIHSIGIAGRAGWGTIEMANIADREIKGTSLPGDEALSGRLQSLLEGGDFGASNPMTKTLVYSAQQLPIQGWLIGQSIDEMAFGALAYGSVAAAASAIVPPAEIATVPAAMFMGGGHGLIVGRTEAAFRLERGLAYSEFRELGFDPDDALLFANAVGGVNAALESIGLGALTKRIPGFRNFQKDAVGDALAQIFTKPTMRHAVTRMTLQYGEQLGTEVLTEVMQESTLMAAREHMKATARDAGDTRPEMAPMEPGEFWNTVSEIATMTLYGTALIGAAGPIANYRADARRARSAEEQAAKWAALGNAVDASTTKDEAPTAWDTFVARIQEKGPLKEMRFDAQGWREYWQSQNVDPAEVAAELGFNIDEMEVTDTDIVVPFNEYLKKLAHTEHHLGLINDFRARPDEMTLRESEQWHKDSDAKIKEFEATLAKEFDTTVSDEIQQDLTGQLVASGYNQQAAEKQARLTAAIFTTVAARAGKDPMQLYQQRLGSVKRQVPAALQGEDIDMEFDPILDRIRAKDFPRQRDIYGQSLFDLIRKAGGIQDQGGELSARDVIKQVPGLVSKTGLSIDGIAEIAFEQGYIPEYDSDLLMEAFDRELGGDLVFGREQVINTELEQLLGQLEAAASFLDEEHIDLDEMSNADVRKYLKGVKTLEQSSDSELKQLTDLVMAMAMREETSDMDPTRPDRFDAILGQVAAALPLVADEQNFQDVEFTDKFVDSNGKPGTATISAQKAYDKAVKQRNLLKRLVDCVNG